MSHRSEDSVGSQRVDMAAFAISLQQLSYRVDWGQVPRHRTKEADQGCSALLVPTQSATTSALLYSAVTGNVEGSVCTWPSRRVSEPLHDGIACNRSLGWAQRTPFSLRIASSSRSITLAVGMMTADRLDKTQKKTKYDIVIQTVSDKKYY